jgi:hypothetical protein
MTLNRMWWCGLDSSGPRYGVVSGFVEHAKEPFGSIRGGDLLTS